MKKLITVFIIILTMVISACSYNVDMTASINDWSKNISEMKFEVLTDNGAWEEKVLTSKEESEPIILYLGTGGYTKKNNVTITDPIAKIEYNNGHKFVFQDNFVSIDGIVYDTGKAENAKRIVEIYSLIPQ